MFLSFYFVAVLLPPFSFLLLSFSFLLLAFFLFLQLATHQLCLGLDIHSNRCSVQNPTQFLVEDGTNVFC